MIYLKDEATGVCIEAIRQSVESGTAEDQEQLFEHRRTLLRINDDLRAKLSSVTDQLCAEARAHGETQAKLTEAEKRAEAAEAQAGALLDVERENRELNSQLFDVGVKLQAAEARARDLTEKLFNACGGHVDLDKLEGR